MGLDGCEFSIAECGMACDNLGACSECCAVFQLAMVICVPFLAAWIASQLQAACVGDWTTPTDG